MGATGDGGPAAGRKLSPEWHDYLHAEAERIRALVARGLEGAPVPGSGAAGLTEGVVPGGGA